MKRDLTQMETVAHGLATLISEGKIAPGTRLPNTRLIAERFEVQEVEAGHALQLLAEYHWLRREGGAAGAWKVRKGMPIPI